MSRSFNCATGACGRCIDGAAIRCSCSHHRHPSQLGSWPRSTVGATPGKSAAVVGADTRREDNTRPEIEDRPAGEARPVLVVIDEPCEECDRPAVEFVGMDQTPLCTGHAAMARALEDVPR